MLKMKIFGILNLGIGNHLRENMMKIEENKWIFEIIIKSMHLKVHVSNKRSRNKVTVTFAFDDTIDTPLYKEWSNWFECSVTCVNDQEPFGTQV